MHQKDPNDNKEGNKQRVIIERGKKPHSMKTELVDFSSPKAIDALKKGEVIAFPTETVYGLGAIASLQAAFDRLVKVKKRPPEKPFTLMGGNHFSFDDYAIISEGVRRVIARFVPGPLTLLLPPKPGLSHFITLDSPTIGIRVPGYKELCDFIDRVGQPLLVPSANKSGEPPLTDAESVYKIFNGEIPYIIDAPSGKSLPSTIINFALDEPKLIRQGGLNFNDIMAVYKGEK